VGMWLHEACKSRNITSEIIPINIANPEEEIEASPDTLVALAYPTHGLLPPWSAIKFIFKMPVKKGAHLICIPTRGRIYIGPLVIPGAAGFASILPALVLPFRGYNIRGSVSFDMPSNMTSLHSRISDKNIKRITTPSKRMADTYFQRLLSGKSIWFTLNNLYEYLWAVLILMVMPLFPIVYLLLGRFYMGKMMFANNKCIGCGACAASCPNNAIVMKGNKNPRPYWKYNCEDCLRCLNYCRQKAVEAGHSWAVLLYFIGGVRVSSYIFKFIATTYPQISYIKNYWTLEIVNSIYYYPAFIFAYFIFFHLIRIKPINTLFTFTTLTHFYRRYNEPETSLRDLLQKKQ